jgi:hypothetical protein
LPVVTVDANLAGDRLGGAAWGNVSIGVYRDSKGLYSAGASDIDPPPPAADGAIDTIGLLQGPPRAAMLLYTRCSRLPGRRDAGTVASQASPSRDGGGGAELGRWSLPQCDEFLHYKFLEREQPRWRTPTGQPNGAEARWIHPAGLFLQRLGWKRARRTGGDRALIRSSCGSRSCAANPRTSAATG